MEAFLSRMFIQTTQKHFGNLLDQLHSQFELLARCVRHHHLACPRHTRAGAPQKDFPALQVQFEEEEEGSDKDQPVKEKWQESDICSTS